MKQKRLHLINIGILLTILVFSFGSFNFSFSATKDTIINQEQSQTLQNISNIDRNKILADFIAPKIAYESGYREELFVDINPEGNIYSEYSFGGPNIQLGGETLEMIKNNFPEEFNAFRWGSWWLSEPMDPWDHNSRIELTFETADHEQARGWANWMMDFVNFFVYTDYFEDGVWSWDEEWDGTWHTLTSVSFSTSVQWPLIMEDYNSLIPKSYGGIAETIDISNASALRMWMWNGGDRIYQSFGASWDHEVEKLIGGFHYEIRDFIPFTILQRSPYQQSGDPLQIQWQLPELWNLTYSTGCWSEYHPNIEEPWNLHNQYSVFLQINEGDTYPDCWVDFDTTFHPYETLPIERAFVEVNPYGYDLSVIQVQHEMAYFIDLQPYIATMPELFKLDLNIRKADPWHNRNDSVVKIDLNFIQPGNHQTEVNSFISNLSITYNWNLVYSNNWSEWEQWRFKENFESDHWEILLNTSDTSFNWTDYLSNSWIYNQSEMLQNSALDNIDFYRESIEFDPRMGGFWISNVECYWNSIDIMTKNPVKTYSEYDLNPHSFDFAYHFGWNRLNVSTGFYKAEAQANLPISNEWDGFNLTYPEYNNGYGFNTWYWWNWDENNVENFNIHLEIFTNDAFYEKDGTNYSVSDFSLDFNYNFHPDSDDLIAPGGRFGWFNTTSQEPIFDYQSEFWNKDTYSNVERITVETWDNSWLNWWGNDVYNGTDINGDPQFYQRFPTSEIVNVTYDIWWGDLAIPHEDFHWNYQMFYNSTDYYWYHDLNTTELADGWYYMNALITDAADNVGGCGWGIEVDNYNESYVTPATIEFLDPTPINGSAVNDTVTFKVNLTDDIGVFAAVYTKDGTGYVLDADNYVSEGIYEFTWDTWAEPENSWHLFSLTVWDMEGHKTIAYYNLTVDNLHLGNEPFVDIVSPAISDETLQGYYTFEVNITDDWGISSVQGRIDDRVNEDLLFNNITGLWEYTYDISSLTHGTHTFTVRVIDVDENQHIREVSIDFFVDKLPKIEFITPSENDLILSGEITFAVNVTDDEGILMVRAQFDTEPFESMEFNSGTGLYELTRNVTLLINGTHTFTVEVRDTDAYQNIVTETLTFIVNDSVTVPISDPPVVTWKTPSEVGEHLEAVSYTFEVTITDDYGIDSVVAQIDGGSTIPMIYNSGTNSWVLSYNLATLSSGTHAITITVSDTDPAPHTIQVSRIFYVEYTTPPLYKNVVPGNFTSADDIFTKPIDFSIDVLDEDGIASVQIQIYEVTGVNPTDVNTPGDVDLSDVRILTGYPMDMTKGNTIDNWTTYTNTWDISQSNSGIYLVEITIADNAVIQGTTTVKMLVIIQNSSIAENPFDNIPGFPIEIFIAMFGIAIITLYKRNKHN